VEAHSSVTIDFADRRHDLDAQFQHSEAQYPGVVIEMSYSQKQRDLSHIADDYILGLVSLEYPYPFDPEALVTLVSKPPLHLIQGSSDQELLRMRICCLVLHNHEVGDTHRSFTQGVTV
jgi:hypothetical protein